MVALALVTAVSAASAACASDDDEPEATTRPTVTTPVSGPTTVAVPASTDEGKGLGAGPWRTDGARIVDAAGRSVRVAGVNLFGFESTNLSPLGLWTVNYRDMLGQIRAEGYNLLRIPWANQMLDQGAAVSGIDYHLNPDLVGLSPIELLDRVVVAAGQVGLKVLLDRHRPDTSGQSALWYTVAYPEQRWLDDWVLLAERYRGNPTVIGADLHNEPRDPACWGCGAEPWDWRLAAERAGNAILAVNPDWLIFVQGVTSYEGRGTWWGGNLAGAGEHPVRLNVPHRLVYTPHEYPTSVHRQSHAEEPGYPANMPGVWDELWGSVHKSGQAPVVVGEFGSRLATDEDKAWLATFLDYLASPAETDFGWIYWAWQPASTDTGGLVADDWRTLLVDKDTALDPVKAPLALAGWTWTPPPPPPGRPPSPPGPEPPTGPPPAEEATSPPDTSAPSSSVPTTSEPPPSTTTTVARSGQLQLSYQNLDADPVNNQAKPTFDVLNDTDETVALDRLAIRYHISHPAGVGTLQLFCDYAHLGCEQVALRAVATGATSGYVEVRFRGGELAPGGSTGEVQVRFASGDWTAMDEGDDPSFRPPAGRWGPNESVSVHLGDRLVSGTSP